MTKTIATRSYMTNQSDNTTTVNYEDYLKSKLTVTPRTGFDITQETHDTLFPFQQDCVRWALRLGRALLGLSFGLGKTRIQCEIARQIHLETNRPFLLICPLGVKHQFVSIDGPVFCINWRYCASNSQIQEALEFTPYIITNYERVRDGNITQSAIDLFAGVSLDEGSVLRSLASKTSDIFKTLFKDTLYKFVATATPSPNSYREIIYYAEFLGIMDHGQALTRWFQRNPNKAGDLKIHPQHEEKFWLWVASWALFLYKPSDLGYSDDGYDLLELRVHYKRIGVDHTRAFSQIDNRGQARLFLDAAGGVKQAVAEKRATLPDRIKAMQEIISEYPDDEHWLLWHHMEDERKAIKKAVPAAAVVYGSQDLEIRENLIYDFVEGRIPILATKPEIAGSGCNFQYHCNKAIFVGIDFKFQDFIQAVHRIWRFQQKNVVDIWIIYAESEDNVMEILNRKWQQHNKLVDNMREIIRKYGLSQENMMRDLVRSIGIERETEVHDLYTLTNNDCVNELKNMQDNSIDMFLTSIPFGNHYEYTTSVEDFGHNPSDADFWVQMDYLIPHMLRTIKPGRIAAIHVKDRILYGHQTPHGFMEIAPFTSECIMAFKKHGWIFTGQRTIVTDVVRENASTYRLGWTEMSKDATKMGCGLPEYLLTFRKPPTDNTDQRADSPVAKDKEIYTRAEWQVDAHSFWRSNGDCPVIPLRELYSFEDHVERLELIDRKGGLPSGFFYEPPRSMSEWVWDDIVFMQSLNSNQSAKREKNHICPLPFDIVKRAINLYSNKGDVVYDPFAGLGTVPMCAIQLGRIGQGCELSSIYYHAALRYCQQAEDKAKIPTLFDYLEEVQKQQQQIGE